MACQRVTESIIDSTGGKTWKSVETFLAQFDLSRKTSALNYEDFRTICAALFESREIKENEWRLRETFSLFDVDKDNLLKEREWEIFCDWLQEILRPVNVLLVIDVQNDFIDGSLALRHCGCGQDGADVIDPINRLINTCNFEKIIYSLDWHPEDHISFYENLHMRELLPESKITKGNAKPFDTVTFSVPRLEQVLWPKHCVMKTWGAQLHKDLIMAENSVQVFKGHDSQMEAYSVFFDKSTKTSTELQNILSQIQATHLYVCGLAYDVCIKHTCLDGLQLGYGLAVIEDCCRGVDLDNIQCAKKLISEKGGLITDSDHVISLINEQKRNIIMSQQLAKAKASLLSLESDALLS